jgi:hypothetical protein
VEVYRRLAALWHEAGGGSAAADGGPQPPPLQLLERLVRADATFNGTWFPLVKCARAAGHGRAALPPAAAALAAPARCPAPAQPSHPYPPLYRPLHHRPHNPLRPPPQRYDAIYGTDPILKGLPQLPAPAKRGPKPPGGAAAERPAAPTAAARPEPAAPGAPPPPPPQAQPLSAAAALALGGAARREEEDDDEAEEAEEVERAAAAAAAAAAESDSESEAEPSEVTPSVLLPWALDDPADAVEAAVAKGLAALAEGEVDTRFDAAALAGAWPPFTTGLEEARRELGLSAGHVEALASAEATTVLHVGARGLGGGGWGLGFRRLAPAVQEPLGSASGARAQPRHPLRASRAGRASRPKPVPLPHPPPRHHRPTPPIPQAALYAPRVVREYAPFIDPTAPPDGGQLVDVAGRLVKLNKINEGMRPPSLHFTATLEVGGQRAGRPRAAGRGAAPGLLLRAPGRCCRQRDPLRARAPAPPAPPPFCPAARPRRCRQSSPARRRTRCA